MLLLDAMEDAPTMYVVLTARNLIQKPACRAMLRELRRQLRRRWPDVRWAVLVEFQKRGALHLNLLTKGVEKTGATCEARLRWQFDRQGKCPPCSSVDGRCYVCSVAAIWCSLDGVDARPSGQWGEAMNDEVGVVQYVTLHFMKPSQAPPSGWRGHRYSCSRDYLVRPASVMREEARSSLRVKRALHRGESLELAQHAEENRPTYSLYRERGIQPGAELSLGAVARRRGARARSKLVRDLADYWRGDLTEEQRGGAERTPEATRRPPALFTMPNREPNV